MTKTKYLLILSITLLIFLSVFIYKYAFYGIPSWGPISITRSGTNEIATGKDLSFLKKIGDKSQIISFGEGTHGSSEFNVYRLAFFKYLVENCNYRFFLVETDFANTVKINDFVLTGKGDPKELLKNQSSWVWSTSEVLDILNWIRNYNAFNSDERKVRFYGVDEKDVLKISRLVKYVLQDQSEEESIGLIKSINQLYHLEKNSKPFILLLTQINLTIQNLVKKNSQIYSNRNNYFILQTCVQLIKHYIKINEVSYYGRGQIIDKCRAENILSILSFYGKGSKAFFAAHNVHIKKSVEGYFFNLVKQKRTGTYLRAAMGDKYYCIYSDFAQGGFRAISTSTNQKSIFYLPPSEDNLSFEILKTFKVPFFMDLNKTMARSWANSNRIFYNVGATDGGKPRFRTLNLFESYDAYIFIPKVMPAGQLN